MKFAVQLRDPFGTLAGEGIIEMRDDSVFGGVAGLVGLRKGKAMTMITRSLTEAERSGQILQVTGSAYVQGGDVPWRVELSEA